MPELPEVETTKRGLEPLIVNRKITSVHISIKKKLRWEIPTHLVNTLKNQIIQQEYQDEQSIYLLTLVMVNLLCILE